MGNFKFHILNYFSFSNFSFQYIFVLNLISVDVIYSEIEKIQDKTFLNHKVV